MLFGILVLFKKSEIGGLNALFCLVMNIGVFCSALVFGPIGEHFGYHMPLIISGFSSLLAVPLVMYFKKTIKSINNSC